MKCSLNNTEIFMIMTVTNAQTFVTVILGRNVACLMNSSELCPLTFILM